MYLEPKKTFEADLENKRGLIFSVSLFLTMALVVLAFEWRQHDLNLIELPENTNTVFEVLADVPSTEIPPPPPPQVQSPQIIEVSDDEVIEEIKVEFDIEMTQQTRSEDFEVYVAPVDIVKEDPDQIFLVVEQNAEPVGGIKAFYQYVGENIHYPAQARRTSTAGKVFVQFVVDRDGTIKMVTVVKGIGAGCDEEAVRIVEGSPKWNPGKQRGKPVRQQMVLPITFKLIER